MSNKGLCIILSSPSGGGKTTLIRTLLSRYSNLRHSISYTTRPPRQEAADLDHYHFITEAEFMRLRDEQAFLEWAVVHGFYYGTKRSDLDSLVQNGYDVILDIDTQGASQLRSQLKEAVFIFIMPPSIKILEHRLRSRRSESECSLNIRLSNARNEIKQYKLFDYVVINDDILSAVDRVRSIMNAEHCRVENFQIDIESGNGESEDLDHES